MKFTILIEDYNLFYTNFLESNNFLNDKSYDEKLSYLLSKKYYQADSLAQALIKLGHEAEVIIPACNPLQLSWLKENDKKLFLKWNFQKPIRSFKSRFFKKYNTFNSIRDEVLVAQLEKEKPDVVFVYSTIWIGSKTLEKIKLFVKKIILQWSCPIEEKWKNLSFNKFDFIVSSSTSIADYFSKKGIPSFYWQQAFDKTILDQLSIEISAKKDLVFIGNFTSFHSYRYEIIEYLLQNNINIDVYGDGKDSMPDDSILKLKIKKPLNGIEMFEKYNQYKMALHIYGEGKENNGIDWTSFAGAKRNFEITGIGTTLLTSYQKNLKELFNEDEILTFKTKEECLEKVRYYLNKPIELKNIAQAGQKKTLKEHTFVNRAESLLKLIIN